MPNDSAATTADAIDLSDLRTRTIQQAKSELPYPAEEPTLSDPNGLYGKAKNFAGSVDKTLSEKVFRPFRQGLNNMGSDLQEAAETGHTQSGGQLTGPARALAGAAGTALKWVPVGESLGDTAAMSVVPSELGPEAKAFSSELQAAERLGPNLTGLRTRSVKPSLPSIYTVEGAQPLADQLGAKIVGSVTKKESERIPNIYGSTKPRDLDLRIDGEYRTDEIVLKMRNEGFEPIGSSVVSPAEAKASGKSFGGPGWKRVEHFENSDRHRVDIWHDSPGPAKTSPTGPEVSPTKVRERQLNLKHLGINLTKMDPADAKNWVGYSRQPTLKIYRGVSDPSHIIEAGDFVTTSKESAHYYGPHIQELDVPASNLRYVRGHINGDPKRVGTGGQIELIYAPSAKLDGLRVREVRNAIPDSND